MAFDGIVISNIVYELSERLTGGRISKIAMPENAELLITIKNNSESYRLLISADASLPLLYLTDINKQSPITAPNFCMLLRKYIGSAKIISISQLGLERIVRISLEHRDELGDLKEKYMYIELMGKHSNIIFCDNEDNIIDSIKHISASQSSLREVLPGRKYYIPDKLSKINPLKLTIDSFKTAIIGSNATISKAIYLSFSGISPIAAEEICFRCSIDSDKHTSLLTDDDIDKLYSSMSSIMELIKSHSYNPHIIYSGDMPIDFSSIKLSCLETNKDYSVKEFDSISRTLYSFYSAKEASIRIKQKSSDLRRLVLTLLERASKKFDLQEKQLKDAGKKDKYKTYADMLHTYGYSLGGGEDKLICENYYDNNKPITVPLDKDLSAAQNAKKYYDKYSKLKRTEETLTSEIKHTKNTIEHMQSILTAIDIATDEADLAQIKDELSDFGYIKKHSTNKKDRAISKQKPLSFTTGDGYKIYVGKNNYQNEELTFKVATGLDWWFHAKNAPGSHVIVKSNEAELPDHIYEIAGSLAAYYSSKRDSDKVEIDYTQKKNIKKVAGAAPGFVIYHTNYSLVAAPTIPNDIKPDN